MSFSVGGGSGAGDAAAPRPPPAPVSDDDSGAETEAAEAEASAPDVLVHPSGRVEGALKQRAQTGDGRYAWLRYHFTLVRQAPAPGVQHQQHQQHQQHR